MNDAALRLIVRNHLADRGTAAVEEICVKGRRHRLDMAGILDGVLHGIELKSDRDNLNLLRDQALAARPRFRRLVLVVGDRHYESAVEQVPRWWGVWLARETDSEPSLTTDVSPAREAKENPKFKRLAQAKLLWKVELETLLTREGVDLAGPPRNKGDLAAIVASELPVDRVEAEIVRALLARRKKAAERKRRLAAERQSLR